MGSVIKHLVISGGGPTIIQTLGAIHHLFENKFIDINNIQTIYGTSAGALLGAILCLRFEWDVVIDYIIKRPWNEVFPISVQNIFDSYTKKGIFDIKLLEKCVKPLFDAKDISINITLEEFYQITNIELHLYTFEVNNFELVDISYKTHPTLQLVSSLQMTCAFPIMISPVFIEDKCYIDGGITCNYPLSKCIESRPNTDEIVGFKNKYNNYTQNKIDLNSNLLDFIINMIFKLIYNYDTDLEQPKIKNEVVCNSKLVSISHLSTVLKSIDARKELFENGRQASKSFLENCI